MAEAKTKELNLIELDGSDLLDLILSEPEDISNNVLDVCENTSKKNSKKLQKKEAKAARKKELRRLAKEAKENKKIAYLLEGDRLQELKRCKRWERILALHERWALQQRNMPPMSGGDGTLPPPTTTKYVPPTLKYCSICKRCHP